MIVKESEFNEIFTQAPKSLTIVLKSTESFRYEPLLPYLPITVRKRREYLLAYRKVNGKVRNFYLGLTEDITYEKLKDAAQLLSIEDNEQYTQTIKERKQVRQNNRYLTKNKTSDNNASLQNQIAALTAELAAAQHERDELKQWQQKYMPLMQEDREVRNKLKAIGANIKNYDRKNATALREDIEAVLEVCNIPFERTKKRAKKEE